jgi:uncharacterized 2Fe-2S/4Fe-4S cluster protein (DUF4445 family)
LAPGETVHVAAKRADVPIVASCGGRGRCGTCIVELLRGPASPPSDRERELLGERDLAKGLRLACELAPQGDIEVRILPASQATFTEILADGQSIDVPLDTEIELREVQLDAPTLDDQLSDFARLERALAGGSLTAELSGLRSLPGALRAADFGAQVLTRGRRLLSVQAAGPKMRVYGAAFDIGTTTIAGSLLDLTSGEKLATSSRTNPQQALGDDVISRMDHAAKGAASLAELQARVAGALNEMLEEMARSAGGSPSDIHDITVAGNTVMQHLFLGLPPQAMAVIPFAPVIQAASSVPARELGLCAASTATVWTMPVASAYVGGDIVAGILAVGISSFDDDVLFIDIGTNGEVVAGNRERAVCAATAAGPAFEGARISCGMRAVPGAVTGVRREGDSLALDVMGDAPPAGLCGTGLVDVVAALVDAGIVDETGLYDPSAKGPLAGRLRSRDSEMEFVVAEGDRDVVLTQRDIRELQLAKGAIAAGATVLLQSLGLATSSLSRVLLAGAFGSTIKPASAIGVGLLPSGIDPGQVFAVGNTAASGARAALASRKARREAERIAGWMRPVELSTRAEFQMLFAEAMMFPATREY